ASFLLSSLYAQVNRNNENWLFGNYAGVSFSGLSPGAFLGSAMSSPEGVAAISDAGLGQLLFYSNGQKVWGNNHQLIDNGDQLLGNANSTQSVLFVPHPMKSRYVYVFTTDAEGGQEGLKYSLIDRDIGNNGGVQYGKKNISLATPVTEKLALLRHCDLQSYWVVAHEWGANKFFSYRINENGIDEQPVETNSGPVYTGAVENAIGYMKPSPKEDLLALAVTGEDRVDLFDFNNITGEPTYLFSIDSIFQPYGLEFSMDQSMLYVGCLDGYIYQYNMQAANVEASKMLVTYTNKLTGALQMAPDGRIYVTKDLDYHLGLIGFPNAPAYNCNYVEQGTYLSGQLSEAGLPPFIPLLIQHKLPHYYVCLGDTVIYNPQFLQDVDSFIFYFGEPSSGVHDTATMLPLKHAYSTVDIHTVELIYYKCGEEYNLKAEVCVQGKPGITLGKDTAICDNTTYYLQGIVDSVYCNNMQTSFLWNTGQTTQAITISPPGKFIVEISNLCGADIDSITIASLPVPAITLGPDIELCHGDTAVIIPFPMPESLIWNDGAKDTIRYITSSGYYEASAINFHNCVAKDDIIITFIDTPNINWQLSDTAICIGQPMELDAGAGFDSYLWQDGSTGETFFITDSGWYFVLVANMCGSDVDSMYVFVEDCSLKLYVPNAFTPDGDGINDVFKAYGIYVEDFEMHIYNRWGEIMFYADDVDNGWDGRFDGKPAAEATYSWKIRYLDATNKYHDIYGFITLLRK
ncbi:MAG: gliding motility-associated C-terminal domain-containing protein, partial [Bacteroidales bacterium]|nr:gliding motility-associated C-terminal domain-containing protein [Bacteroidales bacterium]